VDDWLTYQQASDLLSCHVSSVPKMIAKGQLHSRGVRNGSINRQEVEDLVKTRDEQRAARASRRPRLHKVDRRPDREHEWLTPSQVAKLLGVTRPAVTKRIKRERLPSVEHGGRVWVRRDHLEMIEAARLVRRTRRP
jgi:excisionase family DNA binding protein